MLWYAIDIDEGIINTFKTKKEGVRYYSSSGKSKIMSKGAYYVTNETETHINETYLFDGIESAKRHGFGWAFEKEYRREEKERS